MKRTLIVLLATAAVAGAGPAAAQSKSAAGKAVFDKTCALCHATGIAGAPKYGNARDWGPRVKTGLPALYRSALNGTARGMPGKGGNLSLSDAEVKAAVDYMVAAVASEKAAPAPKAAPGEKTEAPKPAPVVVAPAAVVTASPNAFNRLLVPPARRNPAPAEDGIHDPANPGTKALQPPLEAFAALPKSNAGNRVDWVGALGGDKISPRWDRDDDKAVPPVMDLNIVREVKGSMPDVVYPHKQHTQWLDCSSCHPAIFIPQKGANQISMASILLGQKCGVCHGKVAFPVSECRMCHSKKKDAGASVAGGRR
ncbi:MAG TPA: c(7)-type cytochrome triheme domain-containing protein [Burkholderiales bacterium]